MPIFKKMSRTVSYFVLLPRPLPGPGWEGGDGARGVAWWEPRVTTTASLPQVTQWRCCIRPVASPTWRGLHGTSIGGLCLSSRRRVERPTSCQCWMESRYLLGKDHGLPHYYRWGIGGPEGGTGSRAHSGLGTQPRQSSCLCPGSACLVAPAVPHCGGRAAVPVSCVTLVNRLIWNAPNLGVQEEQGQRSSLAEGVQEGASPTRPVS